MSLPKSKATPPDVVFITVDQWRGDLAPGVIGNWIPTPRLTALTHEATSFRQHYTQAYPCGPARAGLLTGLYAHKHRSIQNGTPLDARHRTIFQAARGVGYAPVLFGYTDTTPDPRALAAADPARGNFAGVAPGLDVGCLLDEQARPWIADLIAKGYDISTPAKGRDGVFAQRAFGEPALYAAKDSETAFLTDQVLGHLQTQDETPFFLHISYIAPHPPFAAPQEWLDQIDPNDIALPQPHLGNEPVHPLADYLRENTDLSSFVPGLSGRTDQASPDVIRQIRHAYAALAAEVDHHIGRIIDQLKAMQRWENTLFIFCGDHGELLFEHGLLGKVGWYDDAAHVPLIIRPPGGGAGNVVDEFSQSIDIFATMVDLLGLEGDANLDGASLAPFLEGHTPDHWRDYAFWSHDFRNLATHQAEQHFGLSSGLCNLHVFRNKSMKYVHFPAQEPLLFDLTSDPDARLNRYRDPSAQPLLLQGLQALLNMRLTHEVEELSCLQAVDGKIYGDRQKQR